MSAVARSPGPPNLLYESPSLDREVGPAAPIARTSSLKRPAPPNIDVEIKNAMTHAIRLLPEVKDWCADPELILVPPESENVPIVRGYACALLQGKRDGVSVNLVFPRADVSEMCRLIGHMQKVARIAVTRGLRVVVRSAEDEVQAWRTQMGRIQEDL
ncbi:MAG TPA: hypothetical protein VLF94_00835, partial [Chlamydiales bacterium]|nr:hypothetical protein [Chlamydiales bacterium]